MAVRRYKWTDYGEDGRLHLLIGGADLQDRSFPLHRHEFSELVIILAGAGIHHVAGREFPISAGDVFVLNGDAEHGFSNSKNLRLCNIMFDPGEFLKTRSDALKLPGYHALFVLEPQYHQNGLFRSQCHLGEKDRLAVDRILRSMWQENASRVLGFETMLQAHFLQLVVLLSRCYSEQKTRDAGSLLPVAGAIAFIEQNFAQELTIPKLSKQAGLSPSHFIRLFKRAIGSSPIDYLIRLRIRRACEIMALDNSPITKIAFDVGFSDSNYFTRQFGKIMGMSPRQYRRSVK